MPVLVEVVVAVVVVVVVVAAVLISLDGRSLELKSIGRYWQLKLCHSTKSGL